MGRRAFIGLAAVGAVALVGWWARLPRTPAALYEARCSACHALADLCLYPRDLRARVVQVMRQLHGADAVIDDAEATTISRYLREEYACP